MSKTLQLSEILLPELEAELAITRRALDAIPVGIESFKPHEKSTQLDSLAAHLAQMAGFASLCLSGPSVDFAAPDAPQSLTFESKEQVLTVFDTLAAQAVTNLKAATNDSLNEPWKLSVGPHVIFEGTRYNAYRTLAINHMVHHRAQLGVYLRLNNHPVPTTYGPSAG
jgi:uncharacterized damage-inducible protein DinB